MNLSLLGSGLDNREVNPLERLFQRSWARVFFPFLRDRERRNGREMESREQVWDFFFFLWKNNIIHIFFDAVQKKDFRFLFFFLDI